MTDHSEDRAGPVTIHACALHRGIKAVDGEPGAYEGGSYEALGLPFMGGCHCCNATLAAYNMYPSRLGFVLCRDCVHPYGFETVEAFEAWEAEYQAAQE